MEVHLLTDKNECALDEDEVINKLHLLAGDVETNPGPRGETLIQ